MKNGFTLIELMLVMIIMGILAMIGVQAYISSQIKGRDTARKGNLSAIAQALELYYTDKNQYPVSNGSGTFAVCYGNVQCGSGPGVCGTTYPVFMDSCANGAARAIYMPTYPIDPVSTQRYWYISNGSQYQLYAHLENSQDAQIITPAPAGSESINCGTNAACNYGVSSPNTNP